jgi:ABC-type nitrate/sulfonate/bicarbonate transport system substrate-binding protein
MIQLLRVSLLIGLLTPIPGRAADSPSKAVFAYGAINAYMTSTWVAREQGFFRKHNVEVEPVFIIATRAAQAMLAGEVQIGLIGPTHVINAVAAGGDMVMFMGNQNNVRYEMVAHPSIKRAEDLKGKKVAIGASQAGLASLGAHVALDYMGLNARRDNIALLFMGEEPLRLAALQNWQRPGNGNCAGVGKDRGEPGLRLASGYGEVEHPFPSDRDGDDAKDSQVRFADGRATRTRHRGCR